MTLKSFCKKKEGSAQAAEKLRAKNVSGFKAEINGASSPQKLCFVTASYN